MAININTNGCQLHTLSSLTFDIRDKCKCIVDFTNPDDCKNKTFVCHIKYIHMLNGDYSEESFQKFALFLTIGRKCKLLRFHYVMKIVSSIVRYLKRERVICNENNDKRYFFNERYNKMLNRYGRVRYTFFANMIENALAKSEKNEQFTYYELNANRPLALTDDTIAKMIQCSVEKLRKYRKEWHMDRNCDVHSSTRMLTKPVVVVDVVFYTLVLLSFYSGARVMGTLYQLTVREYEELIYKGHVDVFAKNFVRITVFLVDRIRQKYQCLFELMLTIYSSEKSPFDKNEACIFSECCSTKQLHTRFDKLYRHICGGSERPDWVRWHAARRWFLGEIYSKCGIKAASKAVGHRNLRTTVRYVQASTHIEDLQHQLNKTFATTNKTTVAAER